MGGGGYHCLPWIIHASFLLSHCQTSYMVSRGKKTKRHFIILGLWAVPQVRVLNTWVQANCRVHAVVSAKLRKLYSLMTVETRFLK